MQYKHHIIKNTHDMFQQRGLTLLEIFIVVVIATVIVAFSFGAFSRFNKNQALTNSVQGVVSALSEARALTLASKNDSVYGVRFESDRVVLFKGGTYDPVSPDNVETTMSQYATIGVISLAGGGQEVIFERLSGRVAQNGYVTLSLISDASVSKTITIDVTGLIDR